MSPRTPLPPHKNKHVAIVHSRASDVAKDVQNHGFVPIVCPMLDVVGLLDAVIPLADFYLLTSAHAAKAMPTGAQAIAIGAQTRAALAPNQNCALFFASAGEALRGAWPEHKKIIHLGGADLAPGTKKILAHYDIKSVSVYKARALNALPDALVTAALGGELHAVMCFSARGADVFTKLALCATPKAVWRMVRGLALSPRVAMSMKNLPFATIEAATSPNRNALLEMLNHEPE